MTGAQVWCSKVLGHPLMNRLKREQLRCAAIPNHNKHSEDLDFISHDQRCLISPYIPLIPSSVPHSPIFIMKTILLSKSQRNSWLSILNVQGSSKRRYCDSSIVIKRKQKKCKILHTKVSNNEVLMCEIIRARTNILPT